MTFKGHKIDFEFVGTWVYRIFVFGVSMGALYAATTFATKGDVVRANEPYVDLPPRMQALERVSVERAVTLKEMAEWRAKKDEVDTRLSVLVENQQRLIDRQQHILDRQQTQIDQLNRR